MMMTMFSSSSQVLPEFDGDDLVQLAALGPATNSHHTALMRGIVEEVCVCVRVCAYVCVFMASRTLLMCVCV